MLFRRREPLFTRMALPSFWIGEREYRCLLVRHRLARSLRLSLHPYQNPPIKLSAPYDHFGEQALLAFVDRRREWIEGHIRSWPAPRIVSELTAIPCLGKIYNFRHDSQSIPGATETTPGTLVIGGRRGSMAAHLKRWLKDKLLKFADTKLTSYLESIAWREPKPRLRLSNAQQLWGSCKPAEALLSLNWRLGLGTASAADYVLAHEVAHLRFADHSNAFWELTQKLYPDLDSERIWLRKQKNELYSWDFSALPKVVS